MIMVFNQILMFRLGPFSKKLLPYPLDLFWSILFVVLYELMRFVESQHIFTILMGIPVPGQQSEIANSILNVFSLAFLSVPAAVVPFAIYLLSSVICKVYKLSIRIVNQVFFLIFTIWFYPFEYTFLKILFLFTKASNVPKILHSFWVIPLIILVANIVITLYQEKTRMVEEENMWNKVLKNQMLRLTSYIVVIFIAIISATIIESVF